MIPPRLKAILRWGLALCILAFLIYSLTSRWDDFQSKGIAFNWGFLAICTAWNAAFFMTQGHVWRQCLRFLGHDLLLTDALYIWSASQVSKYVPGKVMLFLVRVGLAEKKGVPKVGTMISIYLELILMIITSGAVALLFAPAAFDSFKTWHFILFGLVVAAGLATLHPKVLSRLVNIGLRLLKKEKLDFSIPFRQMLLCAAFLVMGWMMHGLSAVAAVKAVGAQSVASWPVITGFFAFAWLIGFLSFLTPGGLGVREGALAVLLSAFYPQEIAIAISLISRVAWILAEVVMAGAFWSLTRQSMRDAS